MTGSLAYRGWHTAPLALPLPLPEPQKRMAARRCNGCGTKHSRYWRSDLEEANGWLCNNCGMNQRRGRGIPRIGSMSSLDLAPGADASTSPLSASSATITSTNDVGHEIDSATSAQVRAHIHAAYSLASSLAPHSHIDMPPFAAIAPSAEPCDNIMDIGGLLCQSPAKNIASATAIPAGYATKSPGLLAVSAPLPPPMMRIHSTDSIYGKKMLNMASSLSVSRSNPTSNSTTSVAAAAAAVVAQSASSHKTYGNYSGYGTLKSSTVAPGSDMIMLSPTESLRSLADASDAAAAAAAAAAAEATYTASPAQHQASHQRHYNEDYPQQSHQHHNQRTHAQSAQQQHQSQQYPYQQSNGQNQQQLAPQSSGQEADHAHNHPDNVQSISSSHPTDMEIEQLATDDPSEQPSSEKKPSDSNDVSEEQQQNAADSQIQPDTSNQATHSSPHVHTHATSENLAASQDAAQINSNTQEDIDAHSSLHALAAAIETAPVAAAAAEASSIPSSLMTHSFYMHLTPLPMQHGVSMPAESTAGHILSNMQMDTFSEMPEQPPESAPVTPTRSQHFQFIHDSTLLLASAAAAAAAAANAEADANSFGCGNGLEIKTNLNDDDSVKSKAHTRRPPVPTFVDPSKRKCGNCGTTRSAGKWRRDRERPDSYLCNKCGMNQRRAQMRLELQQQREAAASTLVSGHQGSKAVAASVVCGVAAAHTTASNTGAAAAAEAAGLAGFPLAGTSYALERTASYTSSVDTNDNLKRGSSLASTSQSTLPNVSSSLSNASTASSALLTTPRQTRSSTRPKVPPGSSSSVTSAHNSVRYSPYRTGSHNRANADQKKSSGASNTASSKGVSTRSHTQNAESLQCSPDSSISPQSPRATRSMFQVFSKPRSSITTAVPSAARVRARIQAASTSPLKRVTCTLPQNYPCNICNECIPTLEIDECQHRICGECIPVILRNSLKLAFIDCPVCVTAARRGQYQVYHQYHQSQMQEHPYYAAGSYVHHEQHYHGTGAPVMAIGQPTPIPVSSLGNFVDSMY